MCKEEGSGICFPPQFAFILQPCKTSTHIPADSHLLNESNCCPEAIVRVTVCLAGTPVHHGRGLASSRMCFSSASAPGFCLCLPLFSVSPTCHLARLLWIVIHPFMCVWTLQWLCSGRSFCFSVSLVNPIESFTWQVFRECFLMLLLLLLLLILLKKNENLYDTWFCYFSDHLG